MRHSFLFFLALTCCCVLMMDIAGGQVKDNAQATPEATTAPSSANQVIRRIYDIRDLLARAPDFTVQGRAPAEQAPAIPVADDTTSKAKEERRQSLIKLIEDFVAPDSWREYGGTIGVIREYQDGLLIQGTADTHQQITRLLQTLRQYRNDTIRVHAYWVVASSGDLEKVLKPIQPANDSSAAHSAWQAVSAEDMTALESRSPHYQAQMLAMNGEWVSAATLRVLPHEDVLAQAGYAATDITWYATRLALEVCPTLDPQTNTATVIIQARVNGQPTLPPAPDTSATTQPIARKLPPKNAATQPATTRARASTSAKPDFSELQEIDTTARVPLGPIILIGSSSIDLNSQSPKTAPLYLFIQVSTQ
jgi:hypothetical protein